MITLSIVEKNYAYKPSFDKDRAAHLNLFRTFLRQRYPDRYSGDRVLHTWSSISEVEPKHIAEFIEATMTPIARLMYADSFAREVAPRDLIIDDFASMAKEKYHFVSKRARYDISARAIQGHAHEGHTVFRPERFPNTTTTDVIKALESTRRFTVTKKPAFNLEEYQRRTQEWIDDIVVTLDDFFEQPQKYTDDVVLRGTKNKAFARLGWMEGQPVNMLELIRGFYFASQMDNFELRQQIQSRHDPKTAVKLGGGSCLPVDMNVLKTYAANLGNYAHAQYSRELTPLNYTHPHLRERVLAELGIVVPVMQLEDLRETDWQWNTVKETAHNQFTSSQNLQNVYVRSLKGVGVADDVAIVLATILPQTFTNEHHRHRPSDGISRMVGATLADLVDTLEKDSHLIFGRGQDETIGLYFAQRFRQACTDRKFRELFNIHKLAHKEEYQLVNEAVLRDFVAASANHPFSIHSSQRYFHLNSAGTCAISEYLKFANNVFFQYGLPYDAAVHMPDGAYKEGATLTFERIPVKNVIHEMGKRISLVRNPATRERKVHDFFAKKEDESPQDK